MKYSYLYLLGTALLLASCEAEERTRTLSNTTFQASIDEANLEESGASEIKYDSKTKENVIIFTDWYVLDMPLTGSGRNSVLGNERGSLGSDALAGYDGFGGAGVSSPGALAASGAERGKVSLRYGLEYVGKGAKFPGGDLSINLNYLAAPIDAIYHYPAGPGEIEGGLGPYFAYGIGGSSGGVSSFGKDNGGFKRFDAGVNFQVGYKLNNGFGLRLGYDLGLANVEYAEEDVKGHTRAFSINVGYQIGKLFKKK